MIRLAWFLTVFLFSVSVSGETIPFPSEDSLTLEQALKRLKPGDFLLLEPGTYPVPEGITIPKGRNGNPGKPITFKARVKGSVNLDGMGQASPVLRIEGSFWNIEGLKIREPKGRGILIKGTHIQLKENEIVGGGHDGIKSLCGTTDLEIVRNRVLGSAENGIDIFGSLRAKIIGNEIREVGGYGIFAKGGARNILIEGNKVIRPRKAGIYIGGISTPELMCGSFECSECRAVNNLVVGAGAHGVFALGCQDGLIAHNTIVNTSSWYGAPLGAGVGGEGKIGSRNIRIANNLVAYPRSKIYFQVESNSGADFSSDYNLYYGLANPQFDWKGTLLSWDALKKNTSSESHAVLKDPQFGQKTGESFSLLPRSPAKEAGMAIDKGLDRDITGKKRNPSQPTIGAWE